MKYNRIFQPEHGEGLHVTVIEDGSVPLHIYINK